MTKHADQLISSWIADVQQAVFQLKEVGYTAMDEDKILVLTQGLPPSYDPFIISLNAAIAANGSDDLDLFIPIEAIKVCLINEESWQCATQSVTTHDVTTAALKPHCPLEQITCFHCGEKGHYQINCQKWKPMKQKALPLLLLKKRSKLGEVAGYVSLYSLCFVLFHTYNLALFVGECQILDANVANSQDTN